MTQSGFIPPSLPSTPSPAAQPAREKPQTQQTNVRETIESIVVAFILAFIFRAFVVEAFVIPTGSMAPTLLGAHMKFYCPDCGYEFTTNYSAQTDGDDAVVPAYNRVNAAGVIRDKVLHLRCPNCGYKFPAFNKDDPNPDNDASGPPIHYGDRILVLKYLYLFKNPARWDVVVFKSPAQADRYDYTQNYIKRLTGRPNEAIMILDGDIYVAPAKPDHDYKLDEFKVQRKTEVAQNALWRIVYDNDFIPRNLDRPDGKWRQPWQVAAGSGWDLNAGASGRMFKFDDAAASGSIAFNPAANPINAFPPKSGATSFVFTDWLAYDQTYLGSGRAEHDPFDYLDDPLIPPQNNVSDIKIGFNYHRTAGEGPLRVSLTKREDTFVAEITRSKVRLLRSRGTGAAVPIAEKEIEVGSRDVRVDFQNVDYEVSLRIDGDVVLKSTDYEPDTDALLKAFNANLPAPQPKVSITADRQTATIQHLGLWRDVYYQNESTEGPLKWAIPDSFPKHVITLGPEEYFVCGDNSAMSFDARLWRDRIRLPGENLDVEDGRVPGRFMLGKAFFVYWPAGHRPVQNLPGIAPNFSEMRFIH